MQVAMVVLGFVLLSCVCHAGQELVEIDRRVDANLTVQPLIAANRSYPDLRIKREDLTRINRESRGIRDWKTMQAALDSVMDRQGQQLHRKYTFQHLVGRGDLLEALRYVGVEIGTEAQETLLQAAKDRREEFNDAHLADVMSICMEALRSVIQPDALEKAVGELYLFRDPSLRAPPETEPFEFNTLPLDILRSKHVRLELKLTVDQLQQLQQVSKRWQRELIPELDGEDDNMLRQQEAKLMAELGQVLNDEQTARLRQLMLQRVLSWYQTQTAVRLLGLEPTLAQHQRLRNHELGLYTEVTVVKHLRGFQMFAPLVQPHLRASRFRDLTTPRFIPHGPKGAPAKMNYEVFADLTGKRKPLGNPRRNR